MRPMGKKTQLILLRHGQSEWNKRNRFTGWVDIPLSFEGVKEAIEAGKRISEIPIDKVYISTLSRAQITAMIALSEHKSGKVPVILHEREGRLENWSTIHDDMAKANTIPVISAWELNERFYGDLQGLNKDETREKYGKEQVHIWRRSFDVPPPGGECLRDTAERAIPYFEKKIVPDLESGKNVFVSAHGNSLRAIIMKLENLSKEEVLSLELATGVPMIYEFENGTFTKK